MRLRRGWAAAVLPAPEEKRYPACEGGRSWGSEEVWFPTSADFYNKNERHRKSFFLPLCEPSLRNGCLEDIPSALRGLALRCREQRTDECA
jgi:hypothetical protein